MATFGKDKRPVAFGRGRAITSAEFEGFEWTASTTPIFLLYTELPAPSGDIVAVGTLSDLHEWIRRDAADFDYRWRALIFVAFSASLAFFLALPEKRRE
jgi:hypothetical protein